MSSAPTSAGQMIGYLRLDPSDWKENSDKVKADAKELARLNPKIRIDVNATEAIAQLEAVAVATKSLQDAQGRVSVAQAKLNDLQAKGETSSSKLASAQENLAKAHRDVELAQIRVAKAFDGGGKSVKDFGGSAESASTGLFSMQVILPLVAAGLSLVGPLAAVGAAGLGTLVLGAKGVAEQFKSGLTPAISELQAVAGQALLPGATETITQLQQALPKLTPLVQVFGKAIGDEAAKLATYLNNGGIDSFTKYAEKELPIVQKALESLTVAGVKMFAALTPLGNDLLKTITALAVGIGYISDHAGEISVGNAAQAKPSGPYQTAGYAGSSSGGYSTSNPSSDNWFVNAAHNVETFLATGGSHNGHANPDYNAKKNKATSDANVAATKVAVDGLSSSASRMAANMQDAAASTMAAQNQVGELAKQAPKANTAMQGLLTGMATYASSAGTAADKGALLGSVLKASQGDALSYAGAIAQGYDAFHNLALTFQHETTDNLLGIKAYRDTEKAAIDLKTGLIDLKATGAAPLVTQLQAMQDAAATAAQATYRHELATKSDAAALTDAQTIFESMTRGTLIDNAAQLGLTKEQATKLADQYFNMPASVTTEVQSIGLNDINTTLQQIGQLLAIVTGQKWVVDLTLSAASLKNLGGLHDVVNGAGTAPVGHADGGWIGGTGGARSDSNLILGSKGEFVVREKYARMYPQALESLNAGNGLPSSSGKFEMVINPSAGMDERAIGRYAASYMESVMV
jgi:hypothetical protein